MAREQGLRRTAPVHFNDCLVHVERNLIVNRSRSTRVEPKVMDVLCALMEEPGAVLSRDDLLDKVWRRSHGGEERLTRAISQLRKALADDSRSPRYIETVPKRGYRLVGSVSEETA